MSFVSANIFAPLPSAVSTVTVGKDKYPCPLSVKNIFLIDDAVPVSKVPGSKNIWSLSSPKVSKVICVSSDIILPPAFAPDPSVLSKIILSFSNTGYEI